jgi:osomolarity two-component system response regulator SSK1
MTLQTNKISGNGPLLCTFDIVHNCSSRGSRRPSTATTPKANVPLQMNSAGDGRKAPDVDSLLCRRILRHVNATLRTRDLPEDPSYFAASASGTPRGKTYELSVLLARGEPIAEPTSLSAEEQAERQPFPQLRLAREPTLDELSRFTETLRGKRVEVHASLRSVFARHLSSYLAAWGMEISHFPIEEESVEAPAKAAAWREEMNSSAVTPTGVAGGITGVLDTVATDNLGVGSISGERFIIIDDDVSVLKKQLLQLRAETPLAGTRTRNLKRPTLSARTRSSPQTRQLGHNLNLGRLPGAGSGSNTVIIHFTSLSKYNHVRDVVSSVLAISPGSYFQPEVMVIPKPVGPRRFLTALHTAVNRPIVDPYFTPIATSPRSPSGYFTPKHLGSQTPYESSNLGPPSMISPGVDLGPSRSSGSWPNIEGLPGVGGTIAQSIANTPGIVSTPASEYFQERSSQSDPSSRASGVVLSSPDGRAYGMYFEPQIRLESSRRNSIGNKNDKRRTPLSRSVSAATVMERGADGSSGNGGSPRRTSTFSNASDGDSRRLSALQTVEEDDPNSTEGDDAVRSIRPGSIRKKTLTRPQEPIGRDRAGSGSTPARPRAPSNSTNTTQTDVQEVEATTAAMDTSNADATTGKKKDILPKRKLGLGKKAAGKGKETMVVPPINVLIVEDNPINQNILSTYLRKKKIKHQSAFDGREAVEKWRTGNFHIILVSAKARPPEAALIPSFHRWISNCQS